jgi:thymidylate synthase ThyX
MRKACEDWNATHPKGKGTYMTDATPPPRQLAKIITDSVSPHGVRLTTMEIVIPRIVLAEFNTHRALSRNSASSRAIPITTMVKRVIDDPYIPEQWGVNGKGMQAHGALEGSDAAQAEDAWLGARDSALAYVRELLVLNVHKQTANRLLEPWMWHTVIVSATEWSNFFHLRCHPAAHPAIRNTAEAMRDAMAASTPRELDFSEWHLPLVDERDNGLRLADKIKMSVARCARVSYLTHDGVRDAQADIDLHDRLLDGGHMSPFEHVASPMTSGDIADRWDHIAGLTGYRIDVTEHFVGNFRGWVQYRKTISGESDIIGHREAAS